MKLTPEEVLHVAALARLDVAPEEVETFSRQLSEILNYVDTLNQVDTQGVAPTSHAVFLTNAFREDEARPSLPTDEALSNAPEREGPDFIVPKVIA